MKLYGLRKLIFNFKIFILQKRHQPLFNRHYFTPFEYKCVVGFTKGGMVLYGGGESTRSACETFGKVNEG